MSELNFLHSGGNKVKITTPDSNPASNRTLKLPDVNVRPPNAIVHASTLPVAAVNDSKLLLALKNVGP